MAAVIWLFLLPLYTCRAYAYIGEQIPFEPLAASTRNNATYTPPDPLDVSDHLFRRQRCPAGYGYCSVAQTCCPSSGHCCYDGCAPGAVGSVRCCFNGGYCQANEECCQDGCMPRDAACCSNGRYCPSPLRCIRLTSTGAIVCCLDTSCSVFLGVDGITSTLTTRTPTTRASTTRRTTTSPSPPSISIPKPQTPSLTTEPTEPGSTTPPSPPSTTSSTTSRVYAPQITYLTYTRTIYWTYWYEFYTLYAYYTYSATPTPYRQLVLRTTTVSCTVTDPQESIAYFASVSSALPTPTYAEKALPLSPSEGVVVVGSCYNTVTASDGLESSSCSSSSFMASATNRLVSGSATAGGFSSGAGRRIEMFGVMDKAVGCILACGIMLMIL